MQGNPIYCWMTSLRYVLSNPVAVISDNAIKLMTEMGFTYDPSTAGSSVRFDPPSKNDGVS